MFLPCSLTSSDNFFIEPLPDARLSLSSSSVFMRSKSSSYEGVNSRFFSCSLSLTNSCFSSLIASVFSLQPGNSGGKLAPRDIRVRHDSVESLHYPHH